MRKFIHYITPKFILDYQERLLRHAPLAWQLQLPVILWSWLLITLITLPIPLLYELDWSGNDDITSVILFGVMTAVLQFFLYGYILIQFNTTKSFGFRTTLHGFYEQLGYLLVMFLCLSQIVFFPYIIHLRKAQLMTEQQIFAEAKTYNVARHYFMDNDDDFRYFPDSKWFVSYKEYEPAPNSTKYRDEYYNIDIKPLLTAYMIEDTTVEVRIDDKYTRSTAGPKLFYTGNDFCNEDNQYANAGSQESFESDVVTADGRSLSPHYTYQLKEFSRAERLKQIKAFIHLYNGYAKLSNDRYYWYSEANFQTPEDILACYERNQFVFTQEQVVSQDYEYTTAGNVSISNSAIEQVHQTLLRAKFKAESYLWERFAICIHIAFIFAMFVFLFKNTKLRAFLLMFVYTGLLGLVVSIISALGRSEVPALHTPLLVLICGLFVLLYQQQFQVYSRISHILLMLSNLMIAYLPIFLYFYCADYIDVWDLYYDQQYCENHQAECEAVRARLKIAEQVCLWGGPILYLLLGSVVYKKAYEKWWAMPVKK